jgi:hypothetical protein
MKHELIQMTTTIRVESGPQRVCGIASKELLDNAVTAPHYAEGKRDALGKEIVLGEEMTYLDYYARCVWYVYTLTACPIESKILEQLQLRGHLDRAHIAEWFQVPEEYIDDEALTVLRYMQVGDVCDTKESAIQFAETLED